jgi:hypothetical protein
MPYYSKIRGECAKLKQMRANVQLKIKTGAAMQIRKCSSVTGF